MKRHIVYGFLAAVFMLVMMGAYYDVSDKYPGAQSSTRQTVSAVISTGPSWLTGIDIITNGTDTGTATIYSGVTSVGTSIIFTRSVVGNTYYGNKVWSIPVKAQNGLYLELSGTTPPYAIVEYIDR